jgi:hypothetical protein
VQNLVGAEVEDMLQDPLKGVLVPLAPEDARAVSAVQVTLEPAARFANGSWSGLTDLVARSGDAALPLGAVLAALPALPDPSATSYDRAYSDMIAGHHAGAGAAFAVVALTHGPVAPSLYGLALALEKLGALDEAETLAGFVSDLPGYTDPRAAALAGYAAFQLRQPKAARVFLAKAARLARVAPEFRGVQRFAQRVLLMQQFALGD